MVPEEIFVLILQVVVFVFYTLRPWLHFLWGRSFRSPMCLVDFGFVEGGHCYLVIYSNSIP